MWDLTAVGHWAVISDRKVPCANIRLHTAKTPFVFDQGFLNKLVWFGGKDMSGLGHCISSCCCVSLVRENLKVLHPGITSFKFFQFRSICLKTCFPSPPGCWWQCPQLEDALLLQLQSLELSGHSVAAGVVAEGRRVAVPHLRHCWQLLTLFFSPQYVPKDLLPVYRDKVVPVADIITPNQFEAE